MMTLALSLLVFAADPDDVAKELGVPGMANLPAVPKKYAADDITAEMVAKNPAKYPLRSAVLDGADAMAASYKLKPIREILQSRVETEKKAILEFQEDLASTILEIDEALFELESAAESRKSEPSLRWQAHADFMMAALKFRSASLEELNLAYGLVHRSELPKVEEIHTGWKLATAEKMLSKSNIRRQMEEAREALETVAKSHAGTPWAKLADRELAAPAGLKWESAEVKPPPPTKIDPKRKKP